MPPSKARAAWRGISSSSIAWRRREYRRPAVKEPGRPLPRAARAGVSRGSDESRPRHSSAGSSSRHRCWPTASTTACSATERARRRRHSSRPFVSICTRPSGDTASACIVVENTRQEAADVVCRVSAFTRRTGGDRFSPTLEIEPERFRLAPGEQQDVNIRLLLDSRRFAIATDYVATLLISGAGHRDLVVQLIARAKSPAPAAKARDAAPEHGTRTSAATRSRASHVSRKR